MTESLTTPENDREISFGTVFLNDDPKGYRWVVSRVEATLNKNFFVAGPIFEIDGKEHIGYGGTCTPKEIVKVVGRMDPERVIQGIEREWRRQFPRITEERMKEFLSRLKEEAQKPSRILPKE